MEKCRQHSDFPGGHPPEYYPSLRLLNFAERTGYGVLSLRWPSTFILVSLYLLIKIKKIKKNAKIWGAASSVAPARRLGVVESPVDTTTN